MKNFWYLFAGYSVIWILIFAYIMKINRKIKELNLKIDRLTSED